ncbi:MAG: peptidoglycan DD-metalloendopeptidase family protein [Actinomycetia bacterium]|nr:peptidoglycan DD-metalloendopeptidase family protein [Actinomycetes bacterium]
MASRSWRAPLVFALMVVLGLVAPPAATAQETTTTSAPTPTTTTTSAPTTTTPPSSSTTAVDPPPDGGTTTTTAPVEACPPDDDTCVPPPCDTGVSWREDGIPCTPECDPSLPDCPVTVCRPGDTDCVEPPKCDPDNPDCVGDPLGGEGISGEAPGDAFEIPSRGAYADQPEFRPSRVVFGEVRTARAQLEDVEAQHRETVGRVKALRRLVKGLLRSVDVLSGDERDALSELDEARAAFETSAVDAYIRGSWSEGNALLDAPSAGDFITRRLLMSSVLESDVVTIHEFIDLRERLGSRVQSTSDDLRLARQSLDSALRSEGALRVEVEDAELAVAMFEAKSVLAVSNLTFPVAGENEFIDSWGFPRMIGTEDEHWHEGVDIFAEYGTPLVATERGVVSKINDNRLGGLSVWLQGESGIKWYYTHLSGLAPDLEVGLLVEGGDELGYVGTSGNAAGTPPHLHMQLHPDGNDPVNPHPVLSVLAERDRIEAEKEEARLQSGVDDLPPSLLAATEGDSSPDQGLLNRLAAGSTGVSGLPATTTPVVGGYPIEPAL